MDARRPFFTAPLYALVVLLLGLLSAPLSAQQPDEWAGRYDSPHGVALELEPRTGGYYGQDGGYYGQGGGGGSVYSHFPNLGTSGTGVGVANVGGGDTIVNAGGVLWWPGK